MAVTIARKAVALRLNFFMLGVLMGGWSTRIPEIKSALHMSDAVLGRTLMGAATGAFLSSRIIGWLVRELGPKRVFYVGTAVFPLGYLTVAYAPNAFFIFLGIFFFAQGYMFLDNPMTIMTQELERESDRKYLSGFHAYWSIGTLSAAFFGSFLIGHVKYSYHLTGLAIISFVVLILSARTFTGQVKGAEKSTKINLPWFGGKALIIWGIGFGMLCSNSAEFGATDWSALFLRDVMDISGQFYVGAYIAFELGMIMSRLLGDTYIHRYGPEKVIRVCGIMAGSLWFISMMVGVSLKESHHVIAYFIILLGYFLAGSGVGPLFPALITAIGNIQGVEIAVALSRALLIAILGFAFVPALIGAISDATSLITAMMLPMGLLILAGLLARVARAGSKEAV